LQLLLQAAFRWQHLASRFGSACVEMKERHANESMKANSSRKLEKKENE